MHQCIVWMRRVMYAVWLAIRCWPSQSKKTFHTADSIVRKSQRTKLSSPGCLRDPSGKFGRGGGFITICISIAIGRDTKKFGSMVWRDSWRGSTYEPVQRSHFNDKLVVHGSTIKSNRLKANQAICPRFKDIWIQNSEGNIVYVMSSRDTASAT